MRSASEVSGAAGRDGTLQREHAMLEQEVDALRREHATLTSVLRLHHVPRPQPAAVAAPVPSHSPKQGAMHGHEEAPSMVSSQSESRRNDSLPSKGRETQGEEAAPPRALVEEDVALTGSASPASSQRGIAASHTPDSCTTPAARGVGHFEDIASAVASGVAACFEARLAGLEQSNRELRTELHSFASPLKSSPAQATSPGSRAVVVDGSPPGAGPAPGGQAAALVTRVHDLESENKDLRAIALAAGGGAGAALEKRVQELVSERNAAARAAAALERTNAALRAAVGVDGAGSLSAMQLCLKESASEVERLRSHTAALEARVQEAENERDRAVQGAQQRRPSEDGVLRKFNERVRVHAAKLEARVRDVEEEKERAEQDHQVRLEAVRAQAAALEHQVRVVEEERERADEQVDVFEGELEEAIRERDEAEARAAALAAELASTRTEAEARAAGQAAELASARAELDETRGKLLGLNSPAEGGCGGGGGNGEDPVAAAVAAKAAWREEPEELVAAKAKLEEENRALTAQVEELRGDLVQNERSFNEILEVLHAERIKSKSMIDRAEYKRQLEALKEEAERQIRAAKVESNDRLVRLGAENARLDAELEKLRVRGSAGSAPTAEDIDKQVMRLSGERHWAVEDAAQAREAYATLEREAEGLRGQLQSMSLELAALRVQPPPSAPPRVTGHAGDAGAEASDREAGLAREVSRLREAAKERETARLAESAKALEVEVEELRAVAEQRELDLKRLGELVAENESLAWELKTKVHETQAAQQDAQESREMLGGLQADLDRVRQELRKAGEEQARQHREALQVPPHTASSVSTATSGGGDQMARQAAAATEAARRANAKIKDLEKALAEYKRDARVSMPAAARESVRKLQDRVRELEAANMAADAKVLGAKERIVSLEAELEMALGPGASGDEVRQANKKVVLLEAELRTATTTIADLKGKERILRRKASYGRQGSLGSVSSDASDGGDPGNQGGLADQVEFWSNEAEKYTGLHAKIKSQQDKLVEELREAREKNQILDRRLKAAQLKIKQAEEESSAAHAIHDQRMQDALAEADARARAALERAAEGGSDAYEAHEALAAALKDLGSARKEAAELRKNVAEVRKAAAAAERKLQEVEKATELSGDMLVGGDMLDGPLPHGACYDDVLGALRARLLSLEGALACELGARGGEVATDAAALGHKVLALLERLPLAAGGYPDEALAGSRQEICDAPSSHKRFNSSGSPSPFRADPEEETPRSHPRPQTADKEEAEEKHALDSPAPSAALHASLPRGGRFIDHLHYKNEEYESRVESGSHQLPEHVASELPSEPSSHKRVDNEAGSLPAATGVFSHPGASEGLALEAALSSLMIDEPAGTPRAEEAREGAGEGTPPTRVKRRSSGEGSREVATAGDTIPPSSVEEQEASSGSDGAPSPTITIPVPPGLSRREALEPSRAAKHAAAALLVRAAHQQGAGEGDMSPPPSLGNSRSNARK
mmetsp:Transcript_62194/g.196788  ORF Transcript_62194/g.196788 Transcript_62194/m.196788 type:complete len:1486 (-) Transcript_62194:56-4513(-)